MKQQLADTADFLDTLSDALIATANKVLATPSDAVSASKMTI
jgi:hypothetical protein